MRSRLGRRLWLGLLVATAGSVLVGTNVNCFSFFSNPAQASLDTCFLFDCQNGAIGGLIDPCAPNYLLFVDCPQLNPGQP